MGLVSWGCGGDMACPNCGSWAVKADRALAGRMVCARCGQPLGLGAGPRRARGRTRRRWSVSLPRRWRGWVALAGLVGVSAALAAQAPGPLPREARPMTPGAPPVMDWPNRPGGVGM